MYISCGSCYLHLSCGCLWKTLIQNKPLSSPLAFWHKKTNKCRWEFNFQWVALAFSGTCGALKVYLVFLKCFFAFGRVSPLEAGGAQSAVVESGIGSRRATVYRFACAFHPSHLISRKPKHRRKYE